MSTRSGLLLVFLALACAPHAPSAPEAVPAADDPPSLEPAAKLQPETAATEVDALSQALAEFPEDRQERTLALASRTHRCCYWGADTSRLVSRDGSPPVQWVGPTVPPFVEQRRDGMTLLILDPHAQGWLGFYRELYGDPGCIAADIRSRCEFAAVMFDREGHELWQVKLDPLFSVPGVEIDDLHWHDRVLYFNEACSVPRKPRCGALVAYDPLAEKVLWRSVPAVSDDAFRIATDRIVAVSSQPFNSRPGGTASVAVLDRKTGRVLARRTVDAMVDEVLVHRDVIEVDSRLGVFWLRMEGVSSGLEFAEVPQPPWFDPPAVSLYDRRDPG